MMFDTVDTVHDVVRIATGVLSTIRIRPERMKSGEGRGWRHVLWSPPYGSPVQQGGAWLWVPWTFHPSGTNCVWGRVVRASCRACSMYRKRWGDACGRTNGWLSTP